MNFFFASKKNDFHPQIAFFKKKESAGHNKTIPSSQIHYTDYNIRKKEDS